MKYSILEIAKILNIPTDGLIDCDIDQLLTDSRSLTYPERTLFFAIRTQSNDGVNFIPELYKHGVRNFVVETDSIIPEGMDNANILRVKSPIQALHSLARAHRAKFSIPVIGITGSKGKTTIKEWLYLLLHDDYRIVRSPRSYNSQIGVPLSIWEINENTELAIVEAGISQEGEMNALENIIRPTIGILTNIDNEHAEGFSSKQQKCKEKCELLNRCECVIYNADDTLINNTINQNCSVPEEIAWSSSDFHKPLVVSKVEKVGNTTHLTYNYLGVEKCITLPFTENLDLQNAVHCLAVMLYLHIPFDTIAQRMEKLAKIGTRLNVIEGCNNCLLIGDSYTSDYNSLPPALDFMARRSTEERTSTVILSDVMNEAYSYSTLYKNIADLLKTRKINRFIGIGPDMMKHSNYFGVNAQFYKSTQEFLECCSISDFVNEQILIKGAPQFHFEVIIETLEAKHHETVLEINLNDVASNFNFFRSKLRPETKIVCMVKAKGYGAGSIEVAKTVQDRGAGYLAVAVLDEGVDLRKAGITIPIMVLNPVVMNYHTLFSFHLEPEIFSIDMCKEIIREAEKYGVTDYPVHIKLDTGMHRLGFLKEQLPELVELLQHQNAIKPCSVFSHLATADCFDMDDYTNMQFKYFDECCAILQAGFEHHILRHILNTAGIIRFTDHQFDMVRLGIGLYGIKILNDGSEDGLRPVSSLHTFIISIKEWEAGTTIGYSRRGVLDRHSRIATIPIGYADGLNRHLGRGNAKVYVNGTYCTIVGNICMDVCMVDVTEANAEVGDSVEIFGEHIPVSTLSDTLDTIPYEVLTSISERVKRVYYRE